MNASRCSPGHIPRGAKSKTEIEHPSVRSSRQHHNKPGNGQPNHQTKNTACPKSFFLPILSERAFLGTLGLLPSPASLSCRVEKREPAPFLDGRRDSSPPALGLDTAPQTNALAKLDRDDTRRTTAGVGTRRCSSTTTHTHQVHRPTYSPPSSTQTRGTIAVGGVASAGGIASHGCSHLSQYLLGLRFHVCKPVRIPTACRWNLLDHGSGIPSRECSAGVRSCRLGLLVLHQSIAAVHPVTPRDGHLQ